MPFTPDPTLAQNAQNLIEQLSRYAQSGTGLPSGAPPPPPTPASPTFFAEEPLAPPPEAGFGEEISQTPFSQAGFDIPPVLGIAVGAGLLYYVLKKK